VLFRSAVEGRFDNWLNVNLENFPTGYSISSREFDGYNIATCFNVINKTVDITKGAFKYGVL
jgi:hypothetical protein